MDAVAGAAVLGWLMRLSRVLTLSCKRWRRFGYRAAAVASLVLSDLVKAVRKLVMTLSRSPAGKGRQLGTETEWRKNQGPGELGQTRLRFGRPVGFQWGVQVLDA